MPKAGKARHFKPSGWQREDAAKCRKSAAAEETTRQRAAPAGLGRVRPGLDQLNRRYFPFTYRDLERLAAFQNRVLASYARAHGLPFLDVVTTMPFDPNLFFDAVHKTYPGECMQGWVTFLLLVPLIEQRLASGAWPKSVPTMPSSHPTFVVPPRLVPVDCRKPA